MTTARLYVACTARSWRPAAGKQRRVRRPPPSNAAGAVPTRPVAHVSNAGAPTIAVSGPPLVALVVGLRAARCTAYGLNAVRAATSAAAAAASSSRGAVTATDTATKHATSTVSTEHRPASAVAATAVAVWAASGVHERHRTWRCHQRCTSTSEGGGPTHHPPRAQARAGFWVRPQLVATVLPMAKEARSFGQDRRSGAETRGVSHASVEASSCSSSSQDVASPTRGKGERPRSLLDLALCMGSAAALQMRESELAAAETVRGRVFTRLGVG